MPYCFLSAWRGASVTALILAVFLASGCGMKSLHPTVRNEKTDSPPGATPDSADAAAREFFGAIARKENEKALTLVLASDRERARKELEHPPSLPDDLQLKTSVLGNRARAHCENEGFKKLGLDLIYVDNQWWVTLR